MHQMLPEASQIPLLVPIDRALDQHVATSLDHQAQSHKLLEVRKIGLQDPEVGREGLVLVQAVLGPVQEVPSQDQLALNQVHRVLSPVAVLNLGREVRNLGLRVPNQVHRVRNPDLRVLNQGPKVQGALNLKEPKVGHDQSHVVEALKAGSPDLVVVRQDRRVLKAQCRDRMFRTADQIHLI